MPENPLEWYNDKFCLKCKTKPCERRSQGMYSGIDWNAKLACILSSNIMLEIDRPQVRKLGRKRNVSGN